MPIGKQLLYNDRLLYTCLLHANMAKIARIYFNNQWLIILPFNATTSVEIKKPPIPSRWLKVKNLKNKSNDTRNHACMIPASVIISLTLSQG